MMATMENHCRDCGGPWLDTSQSERRELCIDSMDALLREVAAIESASASCADTADASAPLRIRVTGNWSIGQIFWHLANAMQASMDGFGVPPLSEQFRATGFRHALLYPVRAKARQREWLVKDMLVTRPHFAAGPSAGLDGQLDPPVQAWTVDGAAFLRASVARIQSGAPMGHTSPTMGVMTRDEWMSYHRRHAALHLSFIHI